MWRYISCWLLNMSHSINRNEFWISLRIEVLAWSNPICHLDQWMSMVVGRQCDLKYTFKRPYEQTGYRNLYLFSLLLSLSSYKTQIQSTLVNNNTYIHMKIIVFLSIIDFWRGQSVRYGPVKIILTEDLTCPYLSYNLSESSEFLYYIWK